MTELVFILDRSGSMSGLEADTIGGFNSMIARQKQAAGEALVSTVLFDNDYVVPNTVVDDGTVDANYFQHLPYLEDFNAENNTHIVSVSAIHVEPMGLYGGRQTSLDALKASK